MAYCVDTEKVERSLEALRKFVKTGMQLSRVTQHIEKRIVLARMSLFDMLMWRIVAEAERRVMRMYQAGLVLKAAE